jgi:chromosome partitioning protein
MGQGVTEFNPTGQAAGEIRRLWSWVEKRAQTDSDKRVSNLRPVKAA